jgi:hypothetical protein
MSNSELHGQIYTSLKLKETQELIEIWRTNDRSEWSDEAFDVVQELLEERGAEIPPQNEPVYERKEETAENDGLEEWEARLLDDENQPDFYDPLDVLSIRDHLNRVAKAAVVFYVLIGLWNLPFIRFPAMGIHLGISDIWRDLPSMLVNISQIAIRLAVTYFSLKALAYILRILMEMEFRSRKGILPRAE